MQVVTIKDGFELHLGGLLLLRHTWAKPAFAIGRGAAEISSDRGHFQFTENLAWREELKFARVTDGQITLSGSGDRDIELTLSLGEGAIALQCNDPAANRLWIDIHASADEAVWGCGEQMSYLNLRGRKFPIWTGEPGVGRDPSGLPDDSPMRAFVGDYWTTYYPQPTFMSSRGYALHIESTAYAEFDFSEADRHSLSIWDIPARVEFFSGNEPAELVPQLAERFGKQQPLPEWAFSGAIIGLKDGANSFARLEQIIDAGAEVSAVWCEDWVGIRQTSFGRRLFWDWKADNTRYPDLASRTADLRARGIGFLGYINPYLAVDGSFFAEAEAAGYFVRNANGETYLVDFGEFTCGMIDLTSQCATQWFADRIIGREMLDIGMAGWMADFGEYLPADAVLSDGSDPMLAHNRWPVLWAEVNARAIARHDNGTQPVFFMRAGGSGTSAHCPLLWAGDQSVDFSRHDGIGTAICAALSAGLIGNAYHHSDIGGYTSLGDTIRTPELLMRWAELATFTPVMRSHEGNRPDENLQIDSTPEILSHFANMTQLHSELAPYVETLCDEAARTGLPLQRAMFLHFPGDPLCRDLQDQYLYGRDLLVAPVIEEGAITRQVYLPAGEEWVHIWSQQAYPGNGWISIDAPLGQPPVFYRQSSAFADLFGSLRDFEDTQ